MRAAVTPAKNIEHIVIAIDPSGGGASMFAVVSAWYNDGLMGVCGLEAVRAKTPDDYAAVLIEHCRLLRAQYPHALFIICPEANLGFESSHINRLLQPVKYTMTMFEAASGVPGMHTTHQSKEVMWSLLTQRLQDRAVVYAKPLVSTSAASEKLKDELALQLNNYSIVIDKPDPFNQPFRFAKKTFTGKHHGNDDLAVMLQFNLLARRRFCTNARYKSYY